MDSSLAESVQQMVRPGKCVDIYYADPETAQKQCWRTSTNTRYVQNFTATTQGGSSTFTIPPNNGLQDVICVFEINAMSAANANGLGLNRGWGYSLIKSISYRYGGSSQFFLSKYQVLQESLRKMPNNGARDDLLSLGGSAVDGSATGLQRIQRAYVNLPLPHTVPTSEGKLPPLPTDLLTQQVQITVELEPLSSIFSIAGGSTGNPAAAALGLAELQVQQVIFDDQGSALARRVDMTTHAYSYPVSFTQQEVTIPLINAAAGSTQNVVLTGFRSGEVKSIQMWITADADTGAGLVDNPFAFYAPENISLSYAGEIYSRFDRKSGSLWNLLNGRMTPAVQDVRLVDGGGGAITITTPTIDEWVECPFAQAFDPVTAHSMYVAGKPIQNGIVNLSFTMPSFNKTGQVLPTANYTLRVSYVYNAVLTFSQGSCDYVL
jgi:hypothetical protein